MAYPDKFKCTVNQKDEELMAIYGVSKRTIGRWRARYYAENGISKGAVAQAKYDSQKKEMTPVQLAQNIPFAGDNATKVEAPVAKTEPTKATASEPIQVSSDMDDAKGKTFSQYRHVITDQFVNLIGITSDGEVISRVFLSNTEAYGEVVAKIVSGDNDFSHYFIEQRIENISIITDNRIKIEESGITVDGFKLSNTLTEEIVGMLQNGRLESDDKLIKFLDNLLMNPDRRVFDQLYAFIKHNDIEITSDGYFLAYKAVRDNYMDIYSGTILNKIGTTIRMPRLAVDDNPNQTCSAGLHACAKAYLKHFGGYGSRTLVLKIHPRDVVSVPVDYDGAKIRVCEYDIVSEIE